MKKTYSNPCIRCGKERIVVKTWKEKIGNSVVINTETACPDPECQKKVNSENKKQQDKYAAMKLRSEQRAQNREAVRSANKKAKLR